MEAAVHVTLTKTVVAWSGLGIRILKLNEAKADLPREVILPVAWLLASAFSANFIQDIQLQCQLLSLHVLQCHCGECGTECHRLVCRLVAWSLGVMFIFDQIWYYPERRAL